jgi:predicted nucleic acid-binding protein
MSKGSAFIDSNVLLYLLSADTRKADCAQAVLNASAVISVQVLNEITSVARRKLNMPWHEIEGFLGLIRSLCSVEPLSLAVHDKGRWLAERYSLSVYDAMIAAAALQAGCATLYSEDMQPGFVIETSLQIVNPFA